MWGILNDITTHGLDMDFLSARVTDSSLETASVTWPIECAWLWIILTIVCTNSSSLCY